MQDETFNYLWDNIIFPLLNARLAYSVSLAIIKDNLMYRYKDDDKVIDELINNDLVMPKTSLGHDYFSIGRIKTLMLNDIYMDKFDVLSYADMLYWIELFNIMNLANKGAKHYIEEN